MNDETQPEWIQQKLKIYAEIEALLPRLGSMEPVPLAFIESLETARGHMWTANEEEFSGENWPQWWADVKDRLKID